MDAENVKGLEIARQFWSQWGRPWLREHHPELAGRVAAGRMQGSDVLGGDDEISRDHCWGPQFWLWLSAEDFAAHGGQLEAMAAAAPNPWKGHRLAGGGDKSVMVESLPEWFETIAGFGRLPCGPADWKDANGSALYFIRHGAVWFDGTGEMARWRSAMHEYPADILRQKLAEECFRVWHHGEYNFVQRMARRRDSLSIAICLGEFVRGVMQLRMLMDRDYFPYWKWLAFEFGKRESAQGYVPLLDALVSSRCMDEQVTLVKRICALLHDELLAEGHVTGRNANRWLLPLLNDHQELKAR